MRKFNVKKTASILILLCVLINSVVFAQGANITTGEFDARLLRLERLVQSRLQAMEENRVVIGSEVVEDFGGSAYGLVSCAPKGYFIYHLDSGVCTEYNLNAQSPFLGAAGDIRYGGPTYYYTAEGGEYYHSLHGNQLSVSVTELEPLYRAWNAELMASSNAQVAAYLNGNGSGLPVQSTSENTNHWAAYSTYFTNAFSGFGYINGGRCEYIAANMLLRYLDYRGLITLPGIEKNNPEDMTYTLTTIGENDNDVNGAKLCRTVDTFCEQRGIDVSTTWSVYLQTAVNEIGSRRAVLLFGYISNEGVGNHVVAAYGYNTYENPGSITYRCHFGWPSTGGNDYTDVHISSATGTIFHQVIRYIP